MIASAAAASFAIAPQAGADTAPPRPELSPQTRVPALRARQEDSQRVFGGTEAKPGAWPFQVALLTAERLDESAASQPDAQFCGGSLIAPQWVLTAAHCLMSNGAPSDPATITVLVGATDLSEGKRFQATKVIVNPGYSETSLDNDLGLIRLDGPADARTIALPEADVKDGKVTVTGWGMMETGGFPTALMQTDLELFPNAACNTGIKQIYARDLGKMLGDISTRMHMKPENVEKATQAMSAFMGDPLTGNMLCAGTASGARDACNGDSGGPLFMDGADGPRQVGIVSWGEGPSDGTAACGHQNAFGVYTRLSNYGDWLKAQMAAE